ncbi:MAG: LpqB family beta-propeller domain-containing protein [Acidobacteriota bacterium]
MSDANPSIYSFNEFEVDALEQTVTRSGENIVLNNRAFDLLLVFLNNSGRLITKRELVDKVWAGQLVEESNLTVQISTLRRTLGDTKDLNSLIQTVSGRGYRFIPEVSAKAASSGASSFTEVGSLSHNPIGSTDKAEPAAFTNEEKSGEGAPQKWFMSTPMSVVVSALLGCLLLIVVGYFWKGGPRANFGAPRNVIKRLTTDGNVEIAAISRDGKFFAYTTNDKGQRTLWLGDTDGGKHFQLRGPSEIAYSRLSFSPDSKLLYYSSYSDQSSEHVLNRMPIFGGAQEKIADGVDDFSLSSDGTQIAFGRSSGDGKDLLLVSDLSRNQERVVASFDKSRSFKFNSVSWSPDGTRLALSCYQESAVDRRELALITISSGRLETIKLSNLYEINQTLWLKTGDGIVITATPGRSFSAVPNYQMGYLDLKSGEYRAITSDLSTYNSLVSGSDDSRSLLTVEHRQVNNIWVAPPDSLSQAKQITTAAFGRNDGLAGLDWTPDGHIVFNNSDQESQFISIMNADGSDQRELTSSGFADNSSIVSNDGRYIVFQSNRSGSFEIWRMNIDGSDLKQLTFGDENVHPAVSRDDRYVYYKTVLSKTDQLRRVSIDGGEPEVVLDKEAEWCGFSSDGKYFAASSITDRPRLAVFSASTNEIVNQFDVPKTAILNTYIRWMPGDQTIVYRDAWGLWAQSINGGEPKKLEDLPKEKLYTYAWSKDGKQFAFVRGAEIRDVILINDFH